MNVEPVPGPAQFELNHLIKNFRPAVKDLLRDYRDHLRWTLRKRLELADDDRLIVAKLKADGYAVIENYWSPERASNMKRHVENFLIGDCDKNFENGAYLRFWDQKGYDQGVR